MVQIEPGLVPIAPNRSLRYPPQGRDLRDGHASEELQLDDLGQVRFHGCQFVERVGQLQRRARVGRVVFVLRAERSQVEQPAPLLRSATTDLVDD